jgi:8-amino-7-oxononanoate synthase
MAPKKQLNPLSPEFVHDFLAHAEASNLKRTLRRMTPLSPRKVICDGRKCLNFSSNDYMGLTFHPALKETAIEWIGRYGSGSGASRLVSGTIDAYLELEHEIAEWKHSEAAIVLGSGYMANVGLIPTLADRKAVIFADKLNHASLNAGCQLSGARFIRYQHNDMEHLRKMIVLNADNPVKIIISDTVFSMDGDIADPEALACIAHDNDCLLYLDDAHATGVFGEHGSGLAKSSSAHIIMSTFSKGMGAYGACAVCSDEMKNYLINRCGSFIYSTALPPGVCGSLYAAVKLMRTEEMAEARRRLLANVDMFRNAMHAAGLDTGGSSTQIVPVIIGSADKALRISSRLFNDGILAVAIRPPTVPVGKARIRISLNACHTTEDIAFLIEKLIAAVRAED